MSTCNEEFEKWFAGRYPREAEFTPPREYQAFKDDAREIWTAGWRACLDYEYSLLLTKEVL